MRVRCNHGGLLVQRRMLKILDFVNLLTVVLQWSDVRGGFVVRGGRGHGISCTSLTTTADMGSVAPETRDGKGIIF